jgi:predicted O-methyltransferase YrrM
MNKLNPGGVIISDNVLYQGMIASDEYVIRRKKTIVKRMRNYLDHIMDHPDFTTTLLPMSDGIALSYYGGKNE